MKSRKIHLILTVFLLCALLQISPAVSAQERLKLATTTSTDNTGLLAKLLPPFEKKFNLKVDVIAVGSGKAMKLGENGDADVLLVHSRPDEDRFIQAGYGVNRRDVMFNDFVLVGPAADPAGIKNIKPVSEIFKVIAEKKALFVSRGDESGTHKKELAIWTEAGVKPSGSWYIEAGRGMGEVLIMANEKSAYTLTDRGTYLAFQKGGKINLPILFEGDPALTNPYGIIAVNPVRYPDINYLGAMALIGWVTSQPGQKIIADFGKEEFGAPLFFPLAIPQPK